MDQSDLGALLSAYGCHTPPCIGDIDSDVLRNMPKDRQIIAVSGEKALSARLPDYLADAPFQGAAAPALDVLSEMPVICGRLAKCRGLRMRPKGIRTRRQRGR